MQLTIVESLEELGRKAAAIIAEEIQRKPDLVLGLATGSSPIPLYQELIRLNRAGEIDCSAVRTFNLDEYVGLDPSHDQSYRHFMNTELFDQINIDKANTHVPDGRAADLEAGCAEYEEKIRAAGGIDVQVLGIGRNGHVAFNEPGSSLDSRTRVVDLTEDTINANARFFETKEDVPTRAVSMGIGTVMEARKIVLVANGANKIQALHDAIEGPVTPDCPASALQGHPDVTFVVTRDATDKLGKK